MLVIMLVTPSIVQVESIVVAIMSETRVRLECDGGRQLAVARFCDGVQDCKDNTDEMCCKLKSNVRHFPHSKI